MKRLKLSGKPIDIMANSDAMLTSSGIAGPTHHGTRRNWAVT